ncbi:MAG: hypothetical protein CL931_01505 [Deltaproteobacteria bacterium]|nr:hypothetical protein [Deltaproteobacteria bacterium]
METHEGIGFDLNLAPEAAAASAGVEAALGARFAAGLEAGFAGESTVGMTKLDVAVALPCREAERAVGAPFDEAAEALASARRVIAFAPFGPHALGGGSGEHGLVDRSPCEGQSLRACELRFFRPGLDGEERRREEEMDGSLHASSQRPTDLPA